jgi:hypothetical protein
VKYVLPFKPRQGMSHTEVIEGARCALEICELGTAERVNIVQFVQAIDSTSGGGIVFETHNLEALYEDAVVLGAFNENQLHPVLDIENTVAYEQRALARWGVTGSRLGESAEGQARAVTRLGSTHGVREWVERAIGGLRRVG